MDRIKINIKIKILASIEVTRIMYSLFLLLCLIIVGIWGFWRDLKNGWEHSIRLRSQNAMIVTSSDVGGVMTLTAVIVMESILHWKKVQIIIEKLIDVSESLLAAAYSAAILQ